jgi:hypothetical protein
MVTLNPYRIKEVGSDFIVVADDSTDVRITFADRQPGSEGLLITKEEYACAFRHKRCQVGLESPVLPFCGLRTLDIFLDHFDDDFGSRSIPSPFPVSRIEVSTK